MKHPYLKYLSFLPKGGTTFLLLLICLTILFTPSNLVQAQVFNSVFVSFAGLVFNVVGVVFGLIFYIGGQMMEFAIEQLVFGFGDLYQDHVGYAIEQVWSVVRSLMNFAFIFGLIYIGFKFILNAEDASAKKNLVTLIIAALLVNFSLYFTKAVIDISHYAAVSLQAPIQTVSGGEVSFYRAISNQLSLVELTAPDSSSSDGGTILLTAAVLAIILLTSGFVFAAIGIILMARFIILLFLLVFSPLLVIGWVFPALASTSKKWLTTLFGQAFMAPAIFIFLYIAIFVMASTDHLGSDQNLAVLINTEGLNNETAREILPYYILSLAFLVGALYAGRALGSSTASAAITMGSGAVNSTRRWATRQPVRIAAAGTGFAGRQTVGRVGHAIKNNQKLATFANKKSVGGALARSTQRVGEKGAESSFDFRNVAGIGKTFGLGTSSKSYQKWVDDIKKREEAAAKRASGGEDTQFYKDAGVMDVYEEHQKALAKRDELLRKLSAEKDEQTRKDLTAEIKTVDTEIEAITKPDKQPKPAHFLGTDDQWKQQLSHNREYAQVRDNMTKLQQNEYAANLAARWTVFRKTANAEAANAIRKEISKDKSERLNDAIVNAVKSSSNS